MLKMSKSINREPAINIHTPAVANLLKAGKKRVLPQKKHKQAATPNLLFCTCFMIVIFTSSLLLNRRLKLKAY